MESHPLKTIHSEITELTLSCVVRVSLNFNDRRRAITQLETGYPLIIGYVYLVSLPCCAADFLQSENSIQRNWSSDRPQSIHLPSSRYCNTRGLVVTGRRRDGCNLEHKNRPPRIR